MQHNQIFYKGKTIIIKKLGGINLIQDKLLEPKERQYIPI